MYKIPKKISVLREREYESFPRNLTNIMSLISMNPFDPAQVVGSFRFSKQEYPSDIDMSNEFVVKNTSIENTLNIVVKAFQEIIKRLKKNKNVKFSDFKCGLDSRFEINIGEYKLNKNNTLYLHNYNPEIIKKSIINLYFNNLIDKKTSDEWLNLVKQKPSYYEHENLRQAIRTKSVLRWKMYEILQGYKDLPLNAKIYLKDAILQRTVTKIDVFAFVSDRLIEITNFMIIIFIDQKSGKRYILSDINWVIPRYLQQNLEKEIAVLSLPESKKHMKLIKRLWLKARNENNIKLLQIIQIFFDSGVSRLYQFKVDTETMKTVLQKVQNPPNKRMDMILQNHKLKMASINENVLSEEQKLKIFNMINQINEHNIDEKKLNNLSEYLKNIIEPQAVQFLKYIKQNNFL